jgi:putative hydrolase
MKPAPEKLDRAGDPTHEDMHVHSTFSDGENAVVDNLSVASRLGLGRIMCVDHVRRDTAWLPDFVAEVERLRPQFPNMSVLIGVEAKILNASGDLDLPTDRAGVDFIHAADHQVPWNDGCLSPRAMAKHLVDGDVTPEEVIANLLLAMHGAMDRHSNLIFSHPFSALPKMGLRESQISDHDLVSLGQRAVATGATFELSESWRCPGLHAVRLLRKVGVRFVVSTDSHSCKRIGDYSGYCTPLIKELGALNA